MSGSYADLSLSELSLNDRPIPGSSKQPFSLLARPSTSTSPREVDDDDNLHEESIFDQDQADEHADDVQERVGDDELVEAAAAAHAEEEEATQRAESKRSVAYNREERLRQDLFVLRKLNTAFSGYNEALGDVHSGTEVSSHLASGTLARCYPSYDVSLSAFQSSSRRQMRYWTNMFRCSSVQSKQQSSYSTNDGGGRRTCVLFKSLIS